MAHEWIHGFSQCWPPGTKCEVWWEAWSVVVAALSLGVAVLTMAVTAVSAVAVFFLGRAANRLAADTEQRSVALRRREARVLAGYLLPEVRQAASATGRLLDSLEPLSGEDFILERTRIALLEQVDAQQMPLTASAVDRLHVLPPGACDTITDALGNLGLALKAARGFQGSRRGVDADLYVVVLKAHVQAAHEALIGALSELNAILGIGR